MDKSPSTQLVCMNVGVSWAMGREMTSVLSRVELEEPVLQLLLLGCPGAGLQSRWVPWSWGYGGKAGAVPSKSAGWPRTAGSWHEDGDPVVLQTREPAWCLPSSRQEGSTEGETQERGDQGGRGFWGVHCWDLPDHHGMWVQGACSRVCVLAVPSEGEPGAQVQCPSQEAQGGAG